jgi:hypothetical protein
MEVNDQPHFLAVLQERALNTHFIGWCMDPRRGLKVFEKEKSFRPAGSETLSFCLFSSLSTDCFIPAPVFCQREFFMLIGSVKTLISTAILLHAI